MALSNTIFDHNAQEKARFEDLFGVKPSCFRRNTAIVFF
jgi:hypothetical protein